MIKITFDTSALLAFFKGEEEATDVKLLLDECERRRAEGIISTLLLTEVYYILARVDIERAEKRFIQLDESILVKRDVDRAVAKKAGELKAKHAGVSIVDCVVAATALVSGTPYVVVSEKDIRHFRAIGEIEAKTPREVFAYFGRIP
ncbi:TPA: PIN domain-containing protein [Candidatus Bathyarchaeota archaeon]|nr:PIN domain-containing protein [Candidatus Bathyarchaeota archaeon]